MRHTVFHGIRAFSYLGALALLLAACSQSPAPSPPVVVRPETRVLDPAMRQALSEVQPDGTLVFSGSVAFQAGNVLVSEPAPKAPNGLLRKVTAVERVGDKTLVHTLQAQIGDALQKGKLVAERELRPSDLRSAVASQPGVRPLADGGFRVGIDVVIYDADGDSKTQDDRVVASGEVRFKPVIKVELDLDCGYLCLADNDLDFMARIGVEQTATLKIAGKGAYGLKKTVPLATFTFASLTFFIGPVPVVITPEIALELRFDGTLGVRVSYQASETFVAVAGAKYDDGWKNLSSLDLNFVAGPVDIPSPFVAAFEVKAMAALRGQLMLYGVVGPTMEIAPYLRLDLRYPRDPVWLLYGGIQGNVGIRVEVLGYSKHYQATLWDESTEISCSGNTAPQVRFLYPDPGTGNVDVNVCCSLQVEVKDAEDGGNCCQVRFTSSNPTDGTGRVLGTVSGSHPQLGYAFTTLGPRTLTATATDSKGQTGSATVNINVINTPPTVAISSPFSGQQFFRGVSYTLRGVSYDRNEPNFQLACSRMVWKDGGTTLGAGYDLPVSLTSNGNHTLTLTGTDSHGGSSSASVNITVVDPPANLPPVVNLTSPMNGIAIGPDTVVKLAGTATDPEGGAVTLSWDVTTGYNPATGTGFQTLPVNPAANGDWKPSDSINYSSWEVSDTLRLRLKAKDPQGNEGSDFIVLYVQRIC